MSRFFAGGSDSESDSDSDREQLVVRPQAPTYTVSESKFIKFINQLALDHLYYLISNGIFPVFFFL